MRTLLAGLAVTLCLFAGCGDDNKSAPRTATLSVGPTRVDFGTLAVGASSTRDLTVKNDGNTSLSNLTATATGDFAVVSSTCSSLVTVATCTVSVRFSPTAAGARTGTLSVASSTAGASTATAELVGEGLVAQARSFCSGAWDGGAFSSSCASASSRFSLSDPGDGGAGDGRVYDMKVGALADGGLPDGGFYNGGSWQRWPIAARTQALAATNCATDWTAALPSKGDALSVADAWADTCLWPTCWTSWTRTPGATAGTFWVVASDGRAWEAPETDLYPALCLSLH